MQYWYYVKLNLESLSVQRVNWKNIDYPDTMSIRIVEFSIGGTKLEEFCLKIKITQGNYWILRISVLANCQKLGIILVIKWFKNWFYQKMPITKNVLLNWYSSMKKKRNIRMIFDIENWLWKSNFGTFWQLAINPKLKIQ